MRILTWNINSVRLRAPLLEKLINESFPDIICLQETKTPDEYFPVDQIASFGYQDMHFHGMKGYNGVAVLSKHPLIKKEIHHRAGKEDCRHISVKFQSEKLGKPIELHCLYVPAGGDEPDPVINEKFDHKLSFIDEIKDWFKKRHRKEDPVIALGDFNIAPLENDVWSHKQLLKVVSHTPIEVEKLSQMKEALSWHDAIRHFVPEEEKCYTWWSYRNRDWKKSNRGRRLDHIWVTDPLVPHLSSHEILSSARDWQKPSDHVPVILDLDI
jgi:exodeoxyribonuclease-3